ncbi:MAG: electron transfer flavoprotein subunit alpha/FixB family protein [Burkholderiales bacterium]|nr:electron transfer flavoprotein subunit alpha/FixB family protein [Ferrovum sp.]
MTILVVAEHDNQHLKTATRHVLAAAQAIGGEIHVLVAGQHCSAVAEAACALPSVTCVRLAQSDALESAGAENMAALVVQLARDYTHLLTAASASGKNWMPRVAALLDVAQISDIVRVDGPDTFTRPIYAGSVWATVRSADSIKIVTVRTTAFEAVPESGGNARLEPVEPAADSGLSRRTDLALNASSRPELETARVVVSGGRGLGSAERFSALLEPLADKLNAALGASRAAVDSGYVPNDYQVGQTGKIVAPDLYIAVGISGAIQHLAGMKASRVIVAINKDPDAPIFAVADYGLVGDLNQVVPALTAAL